MKHVFVLSVVIVGALVTACALPALAAPPITPTVPAGPSPIMPALTATPTVQSVETPVAISTDCGEDMDCFILASVDCTTARMTQTLSFDLFGLIITSVALYEVRGLEADRCLFYQQTIDGNVTLSDEVVEKMRDDSATDEDIAAAEQQATDSMRTTIGLARTCKFDPPDLTAMLTRWATGSFSSNDTELAECTELSQ